MKEPRLMSDNELNNEFHIRFNKKNCKCFKCNDCKELQPLSAEITKRYKK